MSNVMTRLIVSCAFVATLCCPFSAFAEGVTSPVPSFAPDWPDTDGPWNRLCLINAGEKLVLPGGPASPIRMELVLPMRLDANVELSKFKATASGPWSATATEIDESGTLHVGLEPTTEVTIEAKARVTCIEVQGVDFHTLGVIAIGGTVPREPAARHGRRRR